MGSVVQIPGIGNVQFPATMSPDQISAAAHKLYTGASAKQIEANPPGISRPTPKALRPYDPTDTGPLGDLIGGSPGAYESSYQPTLKEHMQNLGRASVATAGGVLGAPLATEAIPATGAAIARQAAKHPLLTQTLASIAIAEGRKIPYVGRLIPPYAEMAPFLFGGRGTPEEPAPAPSEPPVYPGAPLPKTPAPELLQAAPLQRGGTAAPEPAASLGRIPLKQQLAEAQPVSAQATAGPIFNRPSEYGPPRPNFGGEVPPENQGFDWSMPTGPDIGQRVRAGMPSVPRGGPTRPKLIEDMGGKPAESVSGASETYYSGPGQVIGPKPGSAEDLAETRSLQEQVREAAEREGRTIESQARREWFGRNQPGVTKGELTGAPSRPVKYTKTPGVKVAGASKAPPAPARGTVGPGPEEDLTPLLKKSLRQAMRKKGE